MNWFGQPNSPNGAKEEALNPNHTLSILSYSEVLARVCYLYCSLTPIGPRQEQGVGDVKDSHEPRSSGDPGWIHNI